jgi:hypothetical protein
METTPDSGSNSSDHNPSNEKKLPWSFSLFIKYREGSYDFHKEGDFLQSVHVRGTEPVDLSSLRSNDEWRTEGLIIKTTIIALPEYKESTTKTEFTITNHACLPYECLWQVGDFYSSDVSASGGFTAETRLHIEAGTTPDCVIITKKTIWIY